ncbi:MAG: hypothetical protein ACRDZ4_09235 [Egibacteraceae bacterium]
MSNLEFLASVLESLAWPAAAIVIALLFRHQLRNLLSGPMSRMKAGPFEVEWDRLLSEAETELDKPPQPGHETTLSGPLSEELAPVVTVDPTTAVLEAHARIEQELRRLLQGSTNTDSERMGAVRLVRLAADAGVVPREMVAAIEGLSVLRNLTAHGRANAVTEEQAYDYLAMAEAVLFALSRASDGHNVRP